MTEGVNIVKKFILKYRHALPLLIYGIIYMSWFAHLEKTVTKNYRVIHMNIDDYIPFVEVFVIPYFLWFAYVAAVITFLLFKDKDDYYRTCIFLFTGMTIFLTISTLWPNGHHLRPYIMPRDNIFTQMNQGLYRTDTATNLWPSIHVYNSIGAHLGIATCQSLKKYKGIQIGSLILCISIVLSTMFIKQHSAFDVLTALVLAGLMYTLVYDPERSLVVRFSRMLRKNRSKAQISS